MSAEHRVTETAAPAVQRAIPKVEPVAEGRKFTAELLRRTGDKKKDKRSAKLAAYFQLKILADLEALDSNEAGGTKRDVSEIESPRVDTMELAEVTETVAQQMEEEPMVDFIVIRDAHRRPVGYANTEVMPLSEDDGSGKPRDATLFVWLVGVDAVCRGTNAFPVMNEAIMNAALATAKRENLRITTVSMEAGRDVEKKFHRHWGASGVYMRHTDGTLIEAPYIPPPTSTQGGIMTEPADDPHSKWLIGYLDERKTITPEEFLKHADLVYEGYKIERSEGYQGAVENVQAFMRDAVAQICNGKPLEFIDVNQRRQIEAGEVPDQKILGPKQFSPFLKRNFPELHKRFRKIVKDLKKDYEPGDEESEDES